MFDIVIIGGGPAGSTLARLLGHKYKILLLEKRNFNDIENCTNQKCCGGLLAPDSQKMLAKFGLGVPKSVLLGPQLFSVRTIDIKNNVERYYQRHYININREEFDKWLLSLAKEKIEIKTGCVFNSYKEENEVITVNYTCNNEKLSVRTKVLVGADGAVSKVRKLACKSNKEPKKYISIQEWFEAKTDTPYYGAIFDDEITDFYSWTIPKENYIILGCAIEYGENVEVKFELLKEKLKKYGFKFENSFRRNGSFILRPNCVDQICLGKKNIALIGEAAGFISPSSAEGFSYAFKSALELTKALETGIEGFDYRYRIGVKHIIRNIRLKNLKRPAMYNSLIRKYILKSGIMSLDMYE